jgi:SAM-dependent methyltransferase
MVEKIGNVRLHLDDYPGQDLYSDGEIEDRMLQIAKEYRPEDFDQVVLRAQSWPIMYHFSSIRTNILSWYPFKSTDKVLEVGSGCGALTGAVAKRTQAVSCIELSKKRSLINAYRNRDRDNIDIFLGNFQDVEKKLPRDFDAITLIGVFEYASGYIDSKEPYVDFLKQILGHLKPGGHLLLAIENRLGMKYFAGATEDHEGTFFEGIEGYPETSRVHTFSRPELEAILDAAGARKRTFYYPYPDYKFPMTIYSDDLLPKKGELLMNLSNFDRRRFVLFDEAKAYDSIVGEGLFPIFSNSFCLDITGGTL